jgi:hypothetical protein
MGRQLHPPRAGKNKPERTLKMKEPETLGEYRDLFVALAGEDCKAVKFLDCRIAKQGRDEKVIADPTQMMLLLASMM